MSGSVFHIVDVFAEQKYQGNQLAVFMDGRLHSDEEMQKLATISAFPRTRPPAAQTAAWRDTC